MSGVHAYMHMNEQEHRGMEEIGKNLSDLMSRPDVDRGKVVGSLNMLKAAMLLHFAEEEALMKENNYPNFFHHRRSHNYIATELSVFISSFVAGRSDARGDIWPHLKKTLETHITRYDDDLSAFLPGAAG